MSFTEGEIFYFSNPDFPDTPPHPKIVVANRDDGKIIYVYTSTKQQTIERFCQQIENKKTGQPLYTMVEILICDCP